MASITGSKISIGAQPRVSRQIKKVSSPASLHAVYGISGQNSVSFFNQKKSSSSIRLHVSCAAKQETVQKVCEIVRKQLALPDDSNVTGDSKFSSLGADSLDTVEIVMGLEEEFGISVEEDSAQSITTVQDAADLIEDIVAKTA